MSNMKLIFSVLVISFHCQLKIEYYLQRELWLTVRCQIRKYEAFFNSGTKYSICRLSLNPRFFKFRISFCHLADTRFPSSLMTIHLFLFAKSDSAASDLSGLCIELSRRWEFMSRGWISMKNCLCSLSVSCSRRFRNCF